MEALIDASDAAIMLVGRDRRIAHANAQMARLLGIPTESILGTGLDTVHRFLAGSFVDPAALTAQEHALAGDVALRDRVEVTFPRQAVYQRVVAPVREGGGSLLGHIVLYRDVTHEVEGERAKSEFVAVVSHELRTPMTSVKTSLCCCSGVPEGRSRLPRTNCVGIALRNADRLIRLVNDLLDLSRLDAGRMEFVPEPVALGVAIASSVEAVAAFSSAQGVQIVVEPPPEAVIVHGVRGRLEQVFVNLLSNAVKFSPARWARRRALAARRRCRGCGSGGRGAGIPADKLEVIFEPFRQLDSSTTREHGGAGLGLAISHRTCRPSEDGYGPRASRARLALLCPLALAHPALRPSELAEAAERTAAPHPPC